MQERTLEERKKLVDKIVKRDEKRRKRIEAAGIDYECPEIVRSHTFILFCFSVIIVSQLVVYIFGLVLLSTPIFMCLFGSTGWQHRTCSKED